MKICKIILIALIPAIAFQVKADVNYWQTMEQLRKGNAADANITFKEYVESLSAEQLLVAARQCSKEGQEKVKPESWDIAIAALGFFYKYYPLETNNLEDISPLLADLGDKSQPAFWRYSLMQLLGTSWNEKLTLQQSLNAANVMKIILADTHELRFIRVKAARKSTGLFIKAYSINLREDPEVKRLVAECRRYEDVLEDAENGKVQVSEETVERNKQIEAAIADSIQAQIALLAEPNIPVCLGRSLIGSLIELRGYDSAGRIKQAMNNALQNYKNYDEQLWFRFARTNIIYFQNEEAESILQQMISEVKSEHEKKEHLIRLKKELDKGEIEKQPLVSCLVELPEPEVAEPVDVNEMVNWLEKIWLEDESIREIIDSNQWQKLIETVKQQTEN